MLHAPRLLCLAALAAACALPNDPLSGIEVSWSLTEREASDGEDALRLRTCPGSLLRRIELTIEDLADDSRHRTFTFACETGFQTKNQLATLPSNVYVDLREGSYRVTVRALSERGDDDYEVEIDDALEVGASGVARLHVDLSPALAPWELVLRGGESCEVAAGGLRYLDPADDLLDADEDEDATSALYRASLVGEAFGEGADEASPGLALDGADHLCTGAWGFSQRFAVDPGRYVLDVTVDGESCAIPIEIPFAGATTTLDLAKLPCAG